MALRRNYLRFARRPRGLAHCRQFRWSSVVPLVALGCLAGDGGGGAAAVITFRVCTMTGFGADRCSRVVRGGHVAWLEVDWWCCAAAVDVVGATWCGIAQQVNQVAACQQLLAVLACILYLALVPECTLAQAPLRWSHRHVCDTSERVQRGRHASGKEDAVTKADTALE